jgi:hypothetical protein
VNPLHASLNVAWPLVVRLLIVLILWAIDIINTELLIRWSYFEPATDAHSMWQFGQVRDRTIVTSLFDPIPIGLATVFGDHPTGGHDQLIS